MDLAFDIGRSLVEYKIPTIIAILGGAFLVLSFLKLKMIDLADKKPLRYWGVTLLVLGVTLGILAPSSSEPSTQQPQLVVPIQFVTPIPPTPVSELEPTATQPEPTPTNTSEQVGTTESTLELETPEAIPTEAEIQPTPTNTPIFPTSTPPPPAPSPTPEPQKQVFTVPGYQDAGVKLPIPATGLYRITVEDGAYTPWPTDDHPDFRGWTTILPVYKNKEIVWGMTDHNLPGPIQADLNLGIGGYILDMNQAISTAKGASLNLQLEAGDYLVFVPYDEKGQYADNRGEMKLSVTFFPNP